MSTPKKDFADRYRDYVTVAERIIKFYGDHQQGRIITHILEHDLERGFVLIQAEVFREPEDKHPAATGHAFELREASYVNKTSYIENGETSAVGRALAMLGYEIKRGIASREEMEKVDRFSTPITAEQVADIKRLAAEKGIDYQAQLKRWEKPEISDLTTADAASFIIWLKKLKKAEA